MSYKSVLLLRLSCGFGFPGFAWQFVRLRVEIQNTETRRCDAELKTGVSVLDETGKASSSASPYPVSVIVTASSGVLYKNSAAISPGQSGLSEPVRVILRQGRQVVTGPIPIRATPNHKRTSRFKMPVTPTALSLRPP